uniref:Neurocan core protein n=1 Tax=Gasterosteus aculeatus TaxID=69293 RepID=G3PIE6_GASAC
VNMRKVTHQTISEELSQTVLLPCLFTLRPGAGSSHEPPRIKWTKVWGQRGSDGLQKEQPVLVAKDNVVKVKKAFQGRVTLPGYNRNRYNASLALSGLRSSDAGLYRCEVVVGISDEQDTVPLEVTGVLFHYRAPDDRYALSFADAKRVCLENSAVIATPGQLQAAFADGYDNCDAGWLSDQTVRYPIQSPRPGCYGDREDSPGVRNYGDRSPDELFDVYCFAKQLQGEVFHSSVPEKLSLATASTHCHSLGAQLATVGQLYLAWQAGLDQCDPGWLADGSSRYPINVPRKNCGGDEPGVRTVYNNPNRTGFPDTAALYDAFCYRGTAATTEGPSSPPAGGGPGCGASGVEPSSRATDPTAATTPPGNPPESATTEEASISISWVQEEREKTTRDLSAAPALSTSGAVWLTTAASGSNAAAAAATEMESRSAVSESYPLRRRRCDTHHASLIPARSPAPANVGFNEAAPASEAVQRVCPCSLNVREHYSKGLSSHYSQEIETGRRERAGGQTASERKEWGRAVVLYSAAGGREEPVEIEEHVAPDSPSAKISPPPPRISPLNQANRCTVDCRCRPHVLCNGVPNNAGVLRNPRPWVTPSSVFLGRACTMKKCGHICVRVPSGEGCSTSIRKVPWPAATTDALRGHPITRQEPASSPRETVSLLRAYLTETRHMCASKWPLYVESTFVGMKKPSVPSTPPSAFQGLLLCLCLIVHESGAPPAQMQGTVLDEVSIYELVLNAIHRPSTQLGSQEVLPLWLITSVTPFLSGWYKTTIPPFSSSMGDFPSQREVTWNLGISQCFLKSSSKSHFRRAVLSLGTEIASPSSAVGQGMIPVSAKLLQASVSPGTATQRAKAGVKWRSECPPTPSPLPPPTSPSPRSTDMTLTAVLISSPHTFTRHSWQQLVPVCIWGLLNVECEVLGESGGTWREMVAAEEPPLPRVSQTVGAEASQSDPGCHDNLSLQSARCGFPGKTWSESACEKRGHTISNAQIHIDDCQSNPCQNGGTCIDEISSFVCLCLPSYGGATCEKDTEGCEHSWKFHGHCYRYFSGRHTWDAERDCREHSGHLASVHSPAEQNFFRGLSHDNPWNGLNDRTVEDDFQWTHKMDLQYENWRENQPDNFFAGGEDCVVMIAHENGRWNDVPCNYNLPYVCKKGTVLCGAPPTVDNAFLIGRQRSHYDIHSVARYQCADGFLQRHVPTAKCRANGKWDRPKIICIKSRRAHRYRRHHHKGRRERRKHKRHGHREGGRHGGELG